MNNTYKTNKTDWRRLGRSVLLVALLLGTALTARAQDYYVIHANGNYLAHTGGTTIDNANPFDPVTCLWTISDNQITAINPDGTTGNKLGFSYTESYWGRTYSLQLSATGGTYNWTNASSSPSTSYTTTGWGGTTTYNFYLRYNNGWGMADENTHATVTSVTRSTTDNNYAAAYTGAAITAGASIITATGSITYDGKGLYRDAYSTTTVTFTCANPSINSSTTVGDAPSPHAADFGDGWTVTWSVSPTTYGTINATTGVLTITSLPTDMATITITYTATKDAQTFTATKTVTLFKDASTMEEAISGGTTGVASSTVTLNDYEDHNWSYYSDAQCPIHSLNPANVKISYYGNGTGNMTNNSENGAEPSSFSLNATGVQVGPNDAANTFVYYKTLERANADGTGNLSYTTIPNPFQVRPTNGSGSGSASTTRTVYVSGRSRGGANNTTYKIQVTYYDANNIQQTWSDNSNNNVNTTITAKVGTTLTVTAIGRSGNSNNRVYSTITARYDDNSGSIIATATTTSSNYTSGTSASGTIEEEVVIDNTVMRGFYAWRIKSLSTGLTIVGHSVGDTVRAESPIQFQTTNEYGNTVEFVALWAQAKVQSGSSDISSPYASTVTGARERNFHVVNAETTAASFQKSYPCTVIGHLPGSTTLNATRNVTGGFTGAADTKFEDVNITGATSSTWNANNHDLIVGRGCEGTVNYVRGISGAVNPMNYKIRLESGTYQYISFTSGYEQTNGNSSSNDITCAGTSNYIEGVLGCDYDRAAGDNNKLENTGTIIMGVQVTLSNQDVTKKTFDLTVKSGKFFTYLGNNMGAAGAEQSLYMSIANITGLKAGERKLTVEGGVLASIAGGIDAGNQNSDNDVQGLIVRMRGGTVNGAIYGGAATSPASGNRTLIITGGTVKGWIGAGCNGVVGNNVTKGGQTYGKSYVYVGGNVHVGGSSAINGSDGGTVFAAGKGSGASDDAQSGMMAYGTTIVIADDCDILNNVYGGGNFGFAQTSTNMYITGGHVHGDIFGGSNQNNGPDIDIIMKAGKIDGGLYGGCNTSGDISGHINVDVYGTDPAPSANTYAVGQVFGGGNQAAYSGTPVVTVHDDNSCDISIGEVYGGGNQASVTGTNVTIEAGNRIGYVYGGGYGANVTTNGTKVNIKGGTIEHVFGGNNYTGTITGGLKVRVNKDSECPLKIGELYGGGNHAASAAGSIDIGCTGTYVDGDGGHADCNETTNRIGYELEGIGDVFGGANEANISTGITLTIDSGMVYRVFGGNNSDGDISGTITVNIQKTNPNNCGWYVGYVYGGGFNADYSNAATNNPAVNVSAGLVSHNVYGGGKGSGAVVTGNPTVTLSGTAEVGGNVFGGGDAAAVTGDTSVKLQN